MSARDEIEAACDRVRDLLVAKNASYGNSGLEPMRIFSQLDACEGLCARIDDKLARIKHAPDAFGEDVLLDLCGYLVLLMVARARRVARGAATGPQCDDEMRARIRDLVMSERRARPQDECDHLSVIERVPIYVSGV
jgi:hypothetical protein